MTRDQRHAVVLTADLDEGSTGPVAKFDDPVWVELVQGVPAWTPDGRLVTTVDDPDTRRLALDGVPVSPPGLQVRDVLGVDDAGAVVTATGDDPVDTRVCHIGFDGSVTDLGSATGTHSARTGGPTTVVSSTDLTSVRTRHVVLGDGQERGTLRSVAVDPGFLPDVTMIRTGERNLATAVLFPRGHVPGSQRLPVLLAPYGGPHGQLVRSSARMFLQTQWLADQGFAVVVADGRGTPGRGPEWEKSVRDEFATVTLDDQVDALAGSGGAYPDDLDTERVGILGWSYGGYLSALAVLRRPDVFHAAVAGAPVTDWRLYDTFYTERYLGHPESQPEVYERNSLLASAAGLERPLLIVHGMVDDNVVVAHALRLSAALLAAGRPHSVLPLTGVTHMASQEEVAENLFLLQVDFLRQALADSLRSDPRRRDTAVSPHKVVVDCDPGHDDAIALMLAHGSPEIDLLAVTTVAGNQTLEKVTHNARVVATVAGITGVPIAAGADRPMVRAPRTAPSIHGETGLDGPVLPDPQVPLDPRPAVDLIIETVLAHDPGAVTLVPLGPLTNIAYALRRHPPLVDLVAGVVLMGGGYSKGNVTAAAEFNIYCDPEAAQIVFSAGWPVTQVGLDLTHQALATPEVIDRITALGHRAGPVRPRRPARVRPELPGRARASPRHRCTTRVPSPGSSTRASSGLARPMSRSSWPARTPPG